MNQHFNADVLNNNIITALNKSMQKIEQAIVTNTTELTKLFTNDIPFVEVHSIVLVDGRFASFREIKVIDDSFVEECLVKGGTTTLAISILLSRICKIDDEFKPVAYFLNMNADYASPLRAYVSEKLQARKTKGIG